MSSQTARRPSRARIKRRRLGVLVLALMLAAALVAVLTGLGPLGEAVREITLPLRHDDIIRQQAEDKDLDPALIAAVIYEESRFRDQTSQAGARGLMQITPDTADFIARHSGGIRFEQSDLATPQINIAYGSFFLRYLLDHYEGDEGAALAAYNAGIGNVDRWVEEAGGIESFDAGADVPYPETRAYVKNVLERRGEYREHYADELGI
ncbi:MAG TPA: lytic transglycosylase domain-containing protein [Thermoleophilaceae bacterium]|nr:lytic transglycosylase domain-containing protein [Thermoleophilaceae bacterium]